MTAAAEINARIARDGHITVADYMDLALSAYYARGDVFGRGGDFITAPEISQAFGELIGLWCAVTWQQMGRPASFKLIECGPGRGTLMADVLRAAKNVAGFIPAAEIHLVERSPALRDKQRAILQDHKVAWHNDLNSVPHGPQIIIGNEFLDALPIRQFQRTANGWAERVIKADASGALMFATKPTENAPVPIPLAATAEVGAIFERSDAVTAMTKIMSERITVHGGAALLIDYGHAASALGETLQAVKGHKYAQVLAAPGEADVTAHVDFGHVKTTARAAEASVFGPVEQGLWLKRLGIGVRQVQLAKDKTPEAARAIEQGIRRLIEPHGLGVLFKVMALAHPALKDLEGFEGKIEFQGKA
jgi:NADH dehydrogenase [ubiquinone] 1 alpha subcomplex assembly factor 7